MMGFGLLGILLLGGLLLLLLVGGAVLAVWLLLRARPSGGQPPSTARHVLDERLARGEISKDEYDELRAKMER